MIGIKLFEVDFFLLIKVVWPVIGLICYQNNLTIYV